MTWTRRIFLAGTLAACVAALLAACGSAPTTPQMPQLAGVWTGEIMEPGNVNFPDVGLVYVRLDEDGGGQLHGSSKMCHGVFGIHVASLDVVGAVTPTGDVTLDASPFHF